MSRVLCFCIAAYLHCHLTCQSPLESTRLSSLRKLEHSHRLCLKLMQSLPRRTPTNFTLSAVNAVPMETVIGHKKLNFLGPLCNLPCSYMTKRVFNIRLTHCLNLDNQSLGFIPDINRILTKYALLHALDRYLSDGVFLSKCAWKWIIYGKSIQRSNSEHFHECVENYPSALHWYCVLMM